MLCVKRFSLLWEESKDGLIRWGAANAGYSSMYETECELMSRADVKCYKSKYECLWLTLFLSAGLKKTLRQLGICLYSLTQHSQKKIDCCNFILEKIRGIYIEVVTAESYADDITL
jgi:hypothetical protein